MEITGKILKTQTEDGFELDAILSEPQKKMSKVVLHFHGKEGDFLQNHFIGSMAKEYPKNNYAFMSASLRGRSYITDLLRRSATGYEYVQMGSAYDIFEDCVYDIDAWVKILQKYGYSNIYLQQHSSPQKILWYVYQKKPASIKGLILISPSDWDYLFEKYVPNIKENLILAEKLIQEGKGKQLMPVNLWSNCPVSAITFYNWGNTNSNFRIFNYSHPERGFKYFQNVTLPMLAILAENDFSVGKSSRECLNMLKKYTNSTNFQTKVIPNSSHAYTNHEKELAQIIVSWLKRLI